MQKGRKIAIVGGIILIPVLLFVIFLTTIVILNSLKSKAFTQSVRELQLPLENEEDILKRNTLYGNYIGQGNGCTTIEYIIYRSHSDNHSMFQSLQSLVLTGITTITDTNYFWQLFKKEHEQYLELGHDEVVNYGTNPDYWHNEVLGIIIEHERMSWPDNAFVFAVIDEDQGFWATWDPRCQ